MAKFLAMQGLRCSSDFSLAVESGSYSLVAVHGLLIAIASLVSKHRLEGEQASIAAAPRL